MNPKTLVLSTMGLVSFLGGAIAQYYRARHLQPPGGVPVSLVLASALLLFVWYRLDTDQRSYRRTYFLNLGIVALGVVALPYYFFRSRGAKGGLIAILLFILLLMGSFILSYMGQYFTYYAVRI
jgi:hypothetical protein